MSSCSIHNLPHITVPENNEFFNIVRNHSNTYSNLTQGINPQRFLGNCSFRCESGFPSFRKDGYIYVSRRNSNKDMISAEHFVAVNVNLSLSDKIIYLGTHKPSVDTPVQVMLYKNLPNINYMLHSHVYIKDAPFTQNKLPCGSLEEVDEILDCISKNNLKDNDTICINLNGGCGKTTYMLKNIDMLHKNNESFGYIAEHISDKDYSNVINIYRVNNQLYSTFNIDPITYLKDDISNNDLVSIQQLLSTLSLMNHSIPLQDIQNTLQSSNTLLELCHSLKIPLSQQLFTFLSSMAYLPKVPNNEFMLNINSLNLNIRNDEFNNFLYSLINSLFIINEVSHILLDNINMKQCSLIAQACDTANTLKINVQSLSCIEQFQLNKKLNVFMFRSVVSPTDIMKYDLTQIIEKISQLPVGHYINLKLII